MKSKKTVSICLALIVCAGIAGCGAKETATQPDNRTPVEVTSMTKQNMVEYYTASGVAAPIQEIDILPKTPSKILNTYAEVGDTVNAGAVLCALDASDISSQLNQVDAQINQSRAGVTVSQVNKEKAGATGKEQALSQAQSAVDQAQNGVDQAQTALKNAGTSVAQAQAAVDNARQTMESAQKDYENNKTLLESGVISQSVLDGVKSKYDSAVFAYDNAVRSLGNAQTALEAARKTESNAKKSYDTAVNNYHLTEKAQQDNIAAANAQYDQAVAGVGALQAQRDNLQTKLGEMQITSPIQGIVVTRNAKTGEFASQQAPLYTVVDLSKVLINVTVGEQMINKLAPGQNIKVQFRSLEDRLFEGTVDTISYQIDFKKAGYCVNVLVDNPENLIKSGMFAEVKIAVSEKPDVFAIDSKLLFNDNEKYYVYTVDTENKAVKKEVQIGIKNDEFAEVIGGLETSDRIVSKGQANLIPGMEVKIVGGETPAPDSMPVNGDGTSESEGVSL
ncbi:efflux RND transporter periplasmic adaptor subunit [Acetivibrio sp. MSJd-27]|uniref:efflux RND transporter periplasmic adaptor subunit n=1 Tax=Acetivibrio sp. MSJd-27 TaxID=2841523 RepID=UPI001C119452|nr:efflux RND transporter periplasmic adaptor subunit [Acetivibrio sp. MSJd-27]MBU5450445.1 efflux RND transporter periplasmic adaptor subunit [Acetivibrio sp. MSJd-27]